MPTWPLQFKGRNSSGTYNQNFVWKSGTVYVMDNHRAALWCWLQELDLQTEHSILHIDRHNDTLQSQLTEWMASLPPWDCTLEEYLEKMCPSQIANDYPLFRWDNYLSIYLEEFGGNISQCIFATHGEGDEPNYNSVLKPDIWELPAGINYWIEEKDTPWIVNLDLDYFFWKTLDIPGLMVSKSYLREIITPLKQHIDLSLIHI